MKNPLLLSLACLWLLAPAAALAESKQFRLALEPDATASYSPPEQKAMQARTVEVLQKRLRNLGFKNFEVAPQADRLVVVSVYRLDPDQVVEARKALTENAVLEIRLVHAENSELLKQGIVPPRHEKLIERSEREGKAMVSAYLVEKKGLSGKYIKLARADRDYMTGKPQIAFEFDAEGTKLFAQLTQENVRRNLAIVLNGTVLSAPVINEPITAGRGVISGAFTQKEAENLAALLAAPLETPVRLLDESTLSAGAEKMFTRQRMVRRVLFVGAGMFTFAALAFGAFLAVRWFMRRAEREFAPPKMG